MFQLNVSSLRAVLIVLFSFLCTRYHANAQIRWSDQVNLSTDVQVMSSDEEVGINKMRSFLYDSLSTVSHASGVPFYERSYHFRYAKPDYVDNVVIPLRFATRLIYFIRLVDEFDERHTIYAYGFTKQCADNSNVLILTIATTPYKVKGVEIGTFVIVETIDKVGLTTERDLHQLMNQVLRFKKGAISCNQTSFLSEKVKLPSIINSQSNEVKPIVSQDDKMLLFHRQNDKTNIGGRKDDQDVFAARKNAEGRWGIPENMGSPINNKAPNGITSVRPGQSKVYLINQYGKEASGEQGISYAEKTLSGWSFPQNIEVEGFENKSPYLDYCISASQTIMILAVDGKNSLGDQDLYVSFFDFASDKWSEPINLGDNINTFLAETAPFLAADDRTLYFASDGYLGYGGFDLFMTKRLDDSWTQWSTPENLGPLINSEHDDLYYSLPASGKKAYFVSNQSGNKDIFEITLPGLYKPKPVTLLKGSVKDLLTDSILWANVEIKSLDASKGFHLLTSTDSVDGSVEFVLPVPGRFFYKVSAQGYENLTGILEMGEQDKFSQQKNSFYLYKSTFQFPIAKTLPFESLRSDLERDYNISGTHSDYKKRGDESGNLASLDTKHASRTAALIEILAARPSLDFDQIKPQEIQADSETTVPLLLHARLINAANFRPLSAHVVLKQNNQIKLKSKSDDLTGQFQSIVNSGSAYEVYFILEDHEELYLLRIPHSEIYLDIERAFLSQEKRVNEANAILGTRLSETFDGFETPKLEKKVRSKKQGKRIIRYVQKAGALPPSILEDLAYLHELSVLLPDIRIEVEMQNIGLFKKEELIRKAFKDTLEKYPHLNLAEASVPPLTDSRRKKYPKQLIFKVSAKYSQNN